MIELEVCNDFLASLRAAAPIAELVSTLMLTGLIWTIQLVHYPLFANVGSEALMSYEREHCRRITWIVAPLMLCEIGASGVNLISTNFAPFNVLLFALIVIVWLSTALIQVPLHNRLNSTLPADQVAPVIRRLVQTNWIRTAAWSLRAALLVGAMA